MVPLFIWCASLLFAKYCLLRICKILLLQKYVYFFILPFIKIPQYIFLIVSTKIEELINWKMILLDFFQLNVIICKYIVSFWFFLLQLSLGVIYYTLILEKHKNACAFWHEKSWYYLLMIALCDELGWTDAVYY